MSSERFSPPSVPDPDARVESVELNTNNRIKNRAILLNPHIKSFLNRLPKVNLNFQFENQTILIASSIFKMKLGCETQDRVAKQGY